MKGLLLTLSALLPGMNLLLYASPKHFMFMCLTVHRYDKIDSVDSVTSNSSVASPSPPHGNSHSGPSGSSPSKVTEIMSPECSDLLSQIMAWRLLPPSCMNDSPRLPSLIYGATHLARLFGECASAHLAVFLVSQSFIF